MKIEKSQLTKWAERGYVTYDELNSILPDPVFSDEIDTLIDKLKVYNIELIGEDEPKMFKEKKNSTPDFVNPFSHQHRKTLSRWASFSKKQNLLKPYLYKLLTSRIIKEYLDSKTVDNIIHDHLNDKRAYSDILFSLISLYIWHEVCVELKETDHLSTSFNSPE